MTTAPVYTRERALAVWNGVRYNEFRYWAFMMIGKNKKVWWIHTDNKKMKVCKNGTFPTFEDFYSYVKQIRPQDIHVKRTLADGREWVIDVDHHGATDANSVLLKNTVAYEMFKSVMGDNCERMLFSGNRGLHVWLRHDPQAFSMYAPKRVRQDYYERFMVKPTCAKWVEAGEAGSMSRAFLYAVRSPRVQRQLVRIYPDINMSDTARLIHELYPDVDRQVFVGIQQIRAPYSYHTKGQQYSCDIEDILQYV